MDQCVVYRAQKVRFFTHSLVLKYRKGDEDSLMEKISKLNIHSIIKKSNRVSSHLKHLTGFAPQVSAYHGAGAASLCSAVRLSGPTPGSASGWAWLHGMNPPCSLLLVHLRAAYTVCKGEVAASAVHVIVVVSNTNRSL